MTVIGAYDILYDRLLTDIVAIPGSGWTKYLGASQLSSKAGSKFIPPYGPANAREVEEILELVRLEGQYGEKRWIDNLPGSISLHTY
jgi:hypothetical protein